MWGRNGEGACQLTNFKFRHSSVKEVEPGVVVVDNVFASGTHNGAPFGFGPFPPVPTANIHVEQDEERMFLTIKDGKIKKNEIIAIGNSTGLDGFHTKIGGKMSLPPSDEAA